MNKLVITLLAYLGFTPSDLASLSGHPHFSPSPSSTPGSIGDTYTASSLPASSATPSATSLSVSPSASSLVVSIPGFPPLTSKKAYPAPGTCTGSCTSVHDPSIIVSPNGTYFRFSTFDKITIATAPSIRGPWTNRGSALPSGSKIAKPGRNVLWAPDVFLLDGTYYMYYAVSESGSQDSDIGVATSTSLDVGSWTDHGSIGLPDSTMWNKIDPNLFLHGPGEPLLLSFGSYWNGIYQVPMEDPPLAVGDPEKVAHLQYNGTRRAQGLPLDAVEGSYQFWWEVDGVEYYYLFWSAGQCCSQPGVAGGLAPPGEEYKIMACRSRKPSGGFEGIFGRACTDGGGVEVLNSQGKKFYAPGGQGVYYDVKEKSLILYYHYVDPTVGFGVGDFMFGWNKLDMSNGWPVVVE